RSAAVLDGAGSASRSAPCAISMAACAPASFSLTSTRSCSSGDAGATCFSAASAVMPCRKCTNEPGKGFHQSQPAVKCGSVLLGGGRTGRRVSGRDAQQQRERGEAIAFCGGGRGQRRDGLVEHLGRQRDQRLCAVHGRV